MYHDCRQLGRNAALVGLVIDHKDRSSLVSLHASVPTSLEGPAMHAYAAKCTKSAVESKMDRVVLTTYICVLPICTKLSPYILNSLGT